MISKFPAKAYKFREYICFSSHLNDKYGKKYFEIQKIVGILGEGGGGGWGLEEANIF